MEEFEQLRQQNDLETELLQQKALVRSLQSNIEVLQMEIKHSREDVIKAERIVNDLSRQVTNQEADMKTAKLEFEAQLKEKDDMISLKTQAFEELSKNTFSDFPQTPVRDSVAGLRAPQSRSVLYEENVKLKNELFETKSELEHQIRRFNDLVKEIRQRPFQTNLEQDNYVQEQREKLEDLESQLHEEQSRVNFLMSEKTQLAKRAAELDRQNTMLIAQFSEPFLPCYYSDSMTDDDLRSKLDDIQEIIQTNIRLQQRIDDLESRHHEDLPTLNSGSLKLELDKVKADLALAHKEAESTKARIKRLQTSVEFYKMKWEECGDISDSAMTNDADSASVKTFLKRVQSDAEIQKLRVELTTTSARLTELNDEKQRNERALEDLIAKKNDLLVQLTASKESLELKIQTQTTIVEDMQKRLNDIDKTNRKLEEQRIKATSEQSGLKSSLETLQSRFNEIESENQALNDVNSTLTSDLNIAQCELAELRIRCTALSENQQVSQMVSTTLNDFRSAYLEKDNTELVQTQTQLESVRKENETLTNFVKAMNVQQMFAMDKLKATLTDAQLQREAYSQECITLKQKLNALQLEHSELVEKHDTLAQQMVDIDSSDATLESCRKQIQQLRNKISYLEKTVSESLARAEKWNVQLSVSERQCKTLKEISENLERNLQENEEKAKRECNRLQDLCDAANSRYNEGQNTIEQLRTEISEMNNQFATRESQLEQEISEWKTRLDEMERQKLDLHAELDRVNGDLQVIHSREQELATSLEQKQVEINDLIDLKNALDDSCTEKEQELVTCRAEIESLKEKLTDSGTVVQEIRQGLQAEIHSLKQKVAIFEKTQLDNQGNHQSVYDSVNQMLSRIATEADQLPVNLSFPDMSTSEEMGKALEIIEKLQREKQEEVNRRLQSIAERQSAVAAESAEEMVPMQEFNSVVTKLRAQIDTQTAEIQQKMEQIAELKMLEGLRERCALLEGELAAARNTINEMKAGIAGDSQRREKVNTPEILKLQQQIQSLKAKFDESQNTVTKVRVLANKYKGAYDTATQTLNQLKAKYEKLSESLNSAGVSGKVPGSVVVEEEEPSENPAAVPQTPAAVPQTPVAVPQTSSAAPQTSAPQTSSAAPQTPTIIPQTPLASMAPIGQPSSFQSSVSVSTSGNIVPTSSSLMTPSERAGRFKADVMARIHQDKEKETKPQQDDSGVPSLKRKKPSDEE